jgi:hypothetical protein
VRLTLLDFTAQTKSRYLKESFKDIDTVRNVDMLARRGLYHYLRCTETHGVLGNKTTVMLRRNCVLNFGLHARPA